MAPNEAAINHHARELDDNFGTGAEQNPPLIQQLDMRDALAIIRGNASAIIRGDASAIIRDDAPVRPAKMEWAEPGKTRHEQITIDKKPRDYWVHFPKDYDGVAKLPVVLVFNGYESGKKQPGGVELGGAGMEELTKFSKKADDENFIVVYLDGNKKDHHSWNNGQWWFSKQDDVKFTGQVIDKLEANLSVDPDRIYLAGFSQGGSFVHRAVSEMPDRIAAIADVSGWMSGEERRTAKNIPMLAIQSVDDPTVPYEGRKAWLTMKPELHTSRHYRDINDIEEVTPTVRVFHQRDGRMIKDRTYTDPSNGVEIRSLVIEKEGHVWFGGKGAEKSQINATDIVWDFFKKHPKHR